MLPFAAMGHIYFIRNEHDGYIKVGYTERDVYVRHREWKHLIPHRLTLLGVIPGSRSLESSIKNVLFYPYMVVADDDIEESEWFEPAPEVLEFIEGRCMTSRCESTAATASTT
jgi:hypothetical protein